MARTSLRRRGTRPRRRLLWTGQSTGTPATLLAGAGNYQVIPIVVPGDYQGVATTEAGGTTCLRIRGGLTFNSTLVTGALYACIIRYKLANALTPNTAAALISGDIMWYGAWGMEVPQRHVDIDVRVKRKLENDTIAMLVESVVTGATYTMWARALLVGS